MSLYFFEVIKFAVHLLFPLGYLGYFPSSKTNIKFNDKN